MELGYLYGYRPDLSLGATINLGYGYGVTGTPILLAGRLNVAVKGALKWRFAKLGPLDAGLKFEVGYYMLTSELATVAHGFALDAWFLLHYQIMQKLAIEPFFAMQVRAAFTDNASMAFIPLYVGAAVEYRVIPNLKLFFRFGIGGAAVISTVSAFGTSVTDSSPQCGSTLRRA